jgi:hypothetical protein
VTLTPDYPGRRKQMPENLKALFRHVRHIKQPFVYEIAGH